MAAVRPLKCPCTVRYCCKIGALSTWHTSTEMTHLSQIDVVLTNRVRELEPNQCTGPLLGSSACAYDPWRTFLDGLTDDVMVAVNFLIAAWQFPRTRPTADLACQCPRAGAAHV